MLLNHLVEVAFYESKKGKFSFYLPTKLKKRSSESVVKRVTEFTHILIMF